MMSRAMRWVLVIATVVALAVGVTVLTAINSGPTTSTPEAAGTTSNGDTGRSQTDPLPARAAGTGDLTAKIEALQNHLRTATTDATGWATLGLYYVEQARTSINPAFYPKAEAVLKTSRELSPDADNFLAFAGEAALASARHDFAAALDWAKRGVAANPYNAALRGALADAQTQLGMYDDAAKSVQKMVDLRPGTPSFARASYIAELRGDVKRATAAMKLALDDAVTRSDKAFASYYLGELAVNAGDPQTGLTHFTAGLAEDPTYAALYEGKARAEAALGDSAAAVKDFAEAVSRVPLPTYVLEYGDYLASLGRNDEAQQQYKVFLAENLLFESNGVLLDTDATLYYADHGDAAKALKIGEAGVKSRPFLEMQDAYAWALHAAGRDAEALEWSNKSLAPGMRNALFHFHRGMIEKSLGHRKQALTELKMALSINPHFHPLQAPIAQATITELEAK